MQAEPNDNINSEPMDPDADVWAFVDQQITGEYWQELIRKNTQYKKNKQIKNVEAYLQSVVLARITGIIKERITDIIGGSLTDLKEHIESQLPEHWDWANHGSEWHIDHIIPLKYSKTGKFDLEEILSRFNYKNHQPLHRKENIEKGNHYVGPYQPNYRKKCKTCRQNSISNEIDPNCLLCRVKQINDPRAKKEVIAAHSRDLMTLGKDIEAKEVQAVVDAPELTEGEIVDLENGKPKADPAAIKKYFLRQCYDYAGAITPIIAKTYGNAHMKALYQIRKNMRLLTNDDTIIPEDIPKTFAHLSEHQVRLDMQNRCGLSYDNITGILDFNRDVICAKLLHMFGLQLGSKRTLTKEEMVKVFTDNENANHKWIDANKGIICTEFNVKRVTLPTPGDKNYLRIMLDFINGKLKSRYGVAIKLISRHSTTYHLEDMCEKLFAPNLQIPDQT